MHAAMHLSQRGLKLHPTAGFYPDDPMCFPLYEKAQELGVTVLFHCGTQPYPMKAKYAVAVFALIAFLSLPGGGIGSAKLQAFAEILEELRENRHKALVFSQFVGHLALIRAHLDEHGIRYQYLDGSTPVKQRKNAVDAFQAMVWLPLSYTVPRGK